MHANVWPKVIRYLRGGVTAARFSERANISEKAMSRYATGESRVGRNFDKIAKGAGLTPGQLGYVYAWFLMRFYRSHRFELGLEEESEVKEPALAYDPPTVLERCGALKRLDASEVPAHLAPTLTLLRDGRIAGLKARAEAIRKEERRLLREIDLLEQHFEAARNLKQAIKMGRGT